MGVQKEHNDGYAGRMGDRDGNTWRTAGVKPILAHFGKGASSKRRRCGLYRP